MLRSRGNGAMLRLHLAAAIQRIACFGSPKGGIQGSGKAGGGEAIAALLPGADLAPAAAAEAAARSRPASTATIPAAPANKWKNTGHASLGKLRRRRRSRSGSRGQAPGMPRGGGVGRAGGWRGLPRSPPAGTAGQGRTAPRGLGRAGAGSAAPPPRNARLRGRAAELRARHA